MSRLMLVLLLILVAHVPFVTSCGDADKITLKNQGTGENPSGDQGEAGSSDDAENTNQQEEPKQSNSVSHGSEWCVGRPSSC